MSSGAWDEIGYSYFLYCVLRGGSWANVGNVQCRCGFRYCHFFEIQLGTCGFRVILREKGRE